MPPPKRDLLLHDKRAWVNGASRGIGRACAIELASLGASVTVVARTETALIELAQFLNAHYPTTVTHSYVVLDLTRIEDLVDGEFTTRIAPTDILINNSGGPPGQVLRTAPGGVFEPWFRQHVVASHLMVAACHANMKDNGFGRVINVVSTSVKQPIPGLGVSNTIRGAMASWTSTLARELAADGITINDVLPGSTETERLETIVTDRASRGRLTTDQVKAEMLSAIPLGRFATPQDIAHVVGFLASPAAAYITGIHLAVDGGRTNAL